MTTRVDFRKATIVGDNPGRFSDPIVLRLQVEVFERAPADAMDVKFTWSPIWDFPVDQELDELEVGPLSTLGKHEFVVETDPPDVTQIPDPTGPTALLVSLSYKGHEFMHLGFNVIVTCEGELPEVFTSSDCLRREIGRCYTRQTTIAWDATPDEEDSLSSATSDSDAASADETDGPETKKARHENI